MRMFALIVFWVCLLSLPFLAVIAVLVYRNMRNTVGGNTAEKWELIHQAQNMQADRIEHTTTEILRKVSEESPSGGDGQDSGPGQV